MHVRATILARILVWAAGAAEALLLARLLARLMAARPDSPTVAALYAATWPLVVPFAALDRTQRQFGAVLEIATLTVAILVPIGAYILWAVLATGSAGRSS